MGDTLSGAPARGSAASSFWQSDCKDCRAERLAMAGAKQGGRDKRKPGFEYSDAWALRRLERGESRSDRCQRHRAAHAKTIQAIAVPYVDLRVIGQVPDESNPSGPLGGLGPLPVSHRRHTREVELDMFEFGMGDDDVLRLLEGLEHHRVAVVEAGTGTGKSTFMPFRLANPPPGAKLSLTSGGPIVVTEPRLAAATKVARFVGEALCFGCDSNRCDRHIGPGYPVGYQVHGEKHWDGACDLIYVTDGTMINWVRDGRLARIGTVIIDEAHERSGNIDVILAQLREQLHQHPHLRVIIASATLDRDFFISYFGGPEQVFHLSVPAKKSFGYGVPLFVGLSVDQRLTEQGLSIGAGGSIRFDGWAAASDDLREDLRKKSLELAALRCVGETPVEEWPRRMPSLVAEQVAAIAAGTDSGDILAFLPTTDAINRSIAQLERELRRRRVDIDVYPLLSTTPKDISDKATAPASLSRRRKIVVSSNLAETSVTLQGVCYVVDSGLICQPEWDPQIASGGYPTKAHSQSGLRQRWGRVGRDSPGWVFPLYTMDQFLSLPRNTPPESARSNLETFYARLAAAGMDLDSAVPPGAFVAEEAKLDEDARRYIELFRAEGERAVRALRQSGALDSQGDLTSFGRELERFPGEGGHALALMLADQLACVHEVALALTVLTEGRLVGGDEECILNWDRDWPDAWRLRAAHCHRGLAFGCEDDLDVLLRIVWLWQTSEDPLAWCRQWWVNEVALRSAWKEVIDTVDSLSAAMRSEADRAINPKLGMRARAALSRAMVSARYRSVGGDRFVVEHGGDAAEEAVLRYGRLTEPADRILAFHRYRRPSLDDDEVEPPLISHVVTMLDWAELSDSDPELLGLDLVMRVADCGSSDEAVDPQVLSLLEMLPVGVLVTQAEDETGQSLVRVAGGAFPLPVETGPVPNLNGTAPPSGFDREWNPDRRRRGDTPEEELADRILKASTLEQNDEEEPAQSTRNERPYPFDPNVSRNVRLVPIVPGDALLPGGRAVLLGYRKCAGGFELLCEPADPSATSSDPGQQRQFTPWEKVTCRIAGTLQDHERDLIVFRTDDGSARFLVDPRRTPGLDPYDFGFVERLAVGKTIEANVIPDEHGLHDISVLQTAREHLKTAEARTRQGQGRPVQFYRGAVVEPPNKWGKAIAELDHADHDLGLTHRFQVRGEDLARAGIQPIAGARLELGLKKESGRYAPVLDLPNKAAVAIAAESNELDVEKDLARPRQSLLSPQIIARLVTAGVPAHEAWFFYEASLRLGVFAVLPDLPLEILELPVRLISLVAMRRSDLEALFGVRIEIQGWDATVRVSGTAARAVEGAAAYIQEWINAARLSATVPVGQRYDWRVIKMLPGVIDVWVDRKTQEATVLANSREQAEMGLRYILRPAVGYLDVPPRAGGAFFKNEAQLLKTLRAMTGCEIEAPNKAFGATNIPWVVTGPDASHVQQCISYAAAYVPGVQGVVSSRGGNIAFLPDPPRPRA